MRYLKELEMRSSAANIGSKRENLVKVSEVFLEKFSELNLMEREECSLYFIEESLNYHLTQSKPSKDEY